MKSIYCFAALLIVAVNAESSPKTITIPFVKTPIKRSLSKRANIISNQLSSYNDIGYLISIDIGTPAQRLNVVLDTGSSDTWVAGLNCTSPQCPSTKFDSSSSSTFKSSNTNFRTTDNVTGTFATDTISIGVASITNQPFGLVSNISNTSSTDPSYMNGVLGLNYPSSILTSDTHLLSNMVSQRMIGDPIFSIHLNSSGSGEITFGGIDASKYQGDISYLPVYPFENETQNTTLKKYSQWKVVASSFGFRDANGVIDGKFRRFGYESYYYILDTSSTFSYFHHVDAHDYFGPQVFSIDAETGAYIIDCNVNSSQVFFVGLTDVVTQGQNVLVQLNIPLSDLLIPTGISQNGTDLCLFSIISSDSTNVREYILGDSILRHFYMVFDMQENRIGLAVSKNSQGKITSGATRTNKLVNAYLIAIIGFFVTLITFS